MAKKKKVSKDKIKERRLKEALKAQGRTGVYVREANSDLKEGQQVTSEKNHNHSYSGKNPEDGLFIKTESGVHTLPVNQIKKDLVRILLFAVASTVFLYILSKSNTQIGMVLNF